MTFEKITTLTDRVSHQKKESVCHVAYVDRVVWRVDGGSSGENGEVLGNWWWETSGGGRGVAILYDRDLIMNSFANVFHSDSIK